MRLIQLLKEKLFKSTPAARFPYLPDNHKITTGAEIFSAYPQKHFLGNQGVYAYHLILAINTKEESTMLELIRSKFAINSLIRQFATNQNQESLAIDSRSEFGGILVEITTNSIEILDLIDKKLHSPPPPWTAFPNIEPIEITIARQGNLEYWINHIWEPYWSSRSDKEKLEFLENTPLEWKEFINQP